MTEFLTLQEIARAARKNLTDGVWDYLTGGAESEMTLRRNRLGLDSIAFRPRVLRDVTKIDCTATFLGRKMRLPVILAPMGSLQNIEPGGALTVARAAKEFGVVSFLSSVTEPKLEDVAAAVDHPMVFQLYVRGDDSWVDDYVRRAIANRYIALCLTVDTQVYSRRERDLMKRYVSAGRRGITGTDWQAGMTWELVKRLKDKFDLPLILKGIATPEDAALAVDHGVDVVYVSNHGGRQLDHGQATIDMLAEIVAATGGRAEIMIDGGVLRGSDVLKAIALGARCAGIGKLQGLGMAAAGTHGITRVLELLELEIKSGMGLLGIDKLSQLTPAYVTPDRPAPAPHITSAYPFIDIGKPEF